MSAISSFAISEADLSSISSLFQHLSNDELKTFLNNETSDLGTKVDEIIKNSSQIKALESEKEMLIASNKSLAEFNLTKEPAYNNSRKLLTDLFAEVDELREKVEKKKEKLDENSRQTSMDITLALMQTASAEAEEESESIASMFLSQELNLNDFLAQFVEKKMLYHLRRIKTEKLMEYLRTHSNNSQINSNPIMPPSLPSSNLPYNLPPYPILPSPMPNSESATFPFIRSSYR